MIVLARSAPRLRYLASLAMIFLLLVVPMVSVYAQGGGSSIAQGFQATDEDIVPASLVAIRENSEATIELSTVDRPDKLVGVVSNKPLIELSHGSTEIQVVTNGLTLALVTDLNGEVKSGDKITASPIEGVGMKATESSTVVGTAQGDLKKAKTEERTVTEKGDKTQKVHIGLLPVYVEVSFFSVGDEQSSYIPPFLQQLANDASGKNVSPVRILVAALVLLLVLICVTVLLYSAVRSSIISIGRNPLSESAIRKSLLQVGVTILIILLFGVTAMYLVVVV